jgi:hypothetical protein
MTSTNLLPIAATLSTQLRDKAWRTWLALSPGSSGVVVHLNRPDERFGLPSG